MSVPEENIINERFHKFVTSFEQLVDTVSAESEVLEQGSVLLRDLIRVDDWLPPHYAQSDPSRYRQYLLHIDEAERFSIVSFVWGPGQKTPIHDHRTWGLIGMLRGAELEQHFTRGEDGTLTPYGAPQRLESGAVDVVSPRIGDLHQVSNAYNDKTSISIHIYGGNIGRIRRSVYNLDGGQKEFVSGYSNGALQNHDDANLPQALKTVSPKEIRSAWIERHEIAVVDVREESFHAQGHPLFAANLPLSTLELEAYSRLPRRDVAVVVFDDGEGYAEIAGRRLLALGYTNVALLAGGLRGWRDAGYEVFRDVNSPSKAFGELVESRRHTPSLSAEQVKELIEANADIVIADARRLDEFQTMSIPTAVSAPGGELVYRLQALSQHPATRIIVNCAGRTRSIIGTQSLINAGLPNPIAALRNGTIGWKLAGHSLDHGANREAPAPNPQSEAQAAASARRVADSAKALRTSVRQVQEWQRQNGRTTYCFDVRTPQEYQAGHLRGFRSAPGGQLIQETDMFAAVRGARIVLADDDGVRANMAASWLAQMNWEVYVVDDLQSQDFNYEHAEKLLLELPFVPSDVWLSAETLHQWIAEGRIDDQNIVILDFSNSRDYIKDHIPDSWFALRSTINESLHATAQARSYVITASCDAMLPFVWRDLQNLTAKPVYVLTGGNSSWMSSGYSLGHEQKFASQPIDIYRRPYEGIDARESAMQAYLDWEYGLVEQLGRDQTHGFWVL